MAQEKIDLERAKTDFEYFVTHFIVDSRTCRKLKFSDAQLEEIRKIQAIMKERRII